MFLTGALVECLVAMSVECNDDPFFYQEPKGTVDGGAADGVDFVGDFPCSPRTRNMEKFEDLMTGVRFIEAEAMKVFVDAAAMHKFGTEVSFRTTVSFGTVVSNLEPNSAILLSICADSF